jgi:hypothetical protein
MENIYKLLGIDKEFFKCVKVLGYLVVGGKPDPYRSRDDVHVIPILRHTPPSDYEGKEYYVAPSHGISLEKGWGMQIIPETERRYYVYGMNLDNEKGDGWRKVGEYVEGEDNEQLIRSLKNLKERQDKEYSEQEKSYNEHQAVQKEEQNRF